MKEREGKKVSAGDECSRRERRWRSSLHSAAGQFRQLTGCSLTCGRSEAGTPRRSAISIKIVLTLCFQPNFFFFFSPLLSLKGTRCLWKTSLSRMTGALAGKELIGLIRHLDFWADSGRPRLVLCTGQHQGPANTGAGSADRPDYHSLTWVTVATGAQEQGRHRG